MFFLELVIKAFAIVLLLFLMALPFLIEFWGYKKEDEEKVSYKRFRLLLYTVLYTLVITVLLFILKEVGVWFKGLSLVKKLAAAVSIPSRVPYTISVFGVVLLNIAISWGFLLLLPAVKAKIKKLNLIDPLGGKGEFSVAQKIERAVIKKLCTATGMYVSDVLKVFSAVISVAAAIIFAIFLIPALWGGKWIPYGFIEGIFSGTYLYPVLTLLILWEAYFFLSGISTVRSQCPELVKPKAADTTVTKADVEKLRDKCKEEFGAFFMNELDAKRESFGKLSSSHSELTRIIAEGIEGDERNPQAPKENYLVAMDRVVKSDKSILFKGNFFSEFSMYFIRYLSIVVARGDNVIFVCNNNEQIKNVEKYLTQAFAETVSVYVDPNDSKYDAPIWKIVTVDGDSSDINQGGVDNCSILITTLNYVCSEEFENGHGDFVYHLDSVVFTDTLNTVNNYYSQVLMLNSKLKHMTETNAVDAKNVKYNPNLSIHYMSRQVRYFCFDGNDNPGIDKTLQSMLTVDFEAVDATCNCEQTLVCCCKLEGELDENGGRGIPQILNSENLGMILNLAVYCATAGANKVSIFADGLIPYANYMESLNWNLGLSKVNLDGSVEVNSPKYNPDGYQVIIGVDANDNLPAAMRKYRDLASDKPTLLIIVARNYLFRDYYAANIQTLWQSSQIERIPFIENSDDDVIRKILIKANSGGITEEELLIWAGRIGDFKEYVDEKNVEGVLRAILRRYDIPDDKNFYTYFEYTTDNDFDKNGDFRIATRIELRREGQLFEFISGRDWITLIDGDDRIPLQIPKSRICQCFIEGQNFLNNGNIYTALAVDKSAGTVVAKRAAAGTNIETFRNSQVREYTVEYTAEKIVYSDAPKHAAFTAEEGNVRVDGVRIAMFRAPMEVITKGYYALNNFNPSLSDDSPGYPIYYSISEEDNITLGKYAYRKYGDLEEFTFDQDNMNGVPLTAYRDGALMLSLKINTDLGESHDKAANLLSVMLSEILSSMFPSVADSVVIAPVLHGEPDPAYVGILNRYPSLTVKGDTSKDGLEIFIIEDCVSDLGVVSILKHDGSELFKTLFSRVREYLDWYMAAEEKSDYLRFGGKEDLACFDFETVHSLAKILGRADFNPKLIDSEKLIQTVECDFCMKRFQQGTVMTKLDDGRMMCPECAAKVITDKKELRALLDRAKMFLENSYGITLDDEYEFCFETAVKIANTVKNRTDIKRRGTDVSLNSYIDNDKKVHVEYDIPEVNFSELLVRELTHVWQLKNVPGVEEELAEGHIALVSIQYLNYLSKSNLAAARKNYYESYKGISGEGYRRLVRELVAHPELANNPFAYLLSLTSGSITGGTEIPVTPKKPPNPIKGKGGIGKTVTPEDPEKPDRETDESATYFYLSQLSSTEQEHYKLFLEGVKARQDEIDVPGSSSDELERLFFAIKYDHPELFYLETVSRSDGKAYPKYCATAEETEVLQRRIDEAAAVYLAEVNDSMSAYEVALRMHCMIIDNVDYDLTKLAEEKKNGYQNGVIDRIRSMVGVFVDKKAVCAGYAQAFTYLMRKCGIMCAYDAGVTSGGRHAWNIIRLDGDFYYVDATWDDASTTTQTVKRRDMGFSYFAITTEELYRTRKSDQRIIPMPVCTATKCNYYVVNGLTVDSYDIEKLKKMAAAVAKEVSEFFTFKCTSKNAFDDCASKLFTFGDGWSEITKAAAKANKSIDPYKISHSINNELYTITLFYVKK